MALSIKLKVKAKGEHAEKLVRQLSGGLPKVTLRQAQGYPSTALRVKKMRAPKAKRNRGNAGY